LRFKNVSSNFGGMRYAAAGERLQANNLFVQEGYLVYNFKFWQASACRQIIYLCKKDI